MSAVWPSGQTGKAFGFATFPPLNLHAAFSLERPARTIEFQAFNGTLHAGKIKAYIQLCLAISAQALTTKAASLARPVTDNPKYTFCRPSLEINSSAGYARPLQAMAVASQPLGLTS